jgi:hypothetical protein
MSLLSPLPGTANARTIPTLARWGSNHLVDPLSTLFPTSGTIAPCLYVKGFCGVSKGIYVTAGVQGGIFLHDRARRQRKLGVKLSPGPDGRAIRMSR